MGSAVSCNSRVGISYELKNREIKKVDDFLSGYSDALSRAVDFDNGIASATSAISSKFSMASSAAVNLADLIILSLRQTVGSLEFTAPQLSTTSQGMDDLRVFMKDVGTSRCVCVLY